MFYFSQTRNLGIDTLSTACESSIMNSSFLFQILLVDKVKCAAGDNM